MDSLSRFVTAPTVFTLRNLQASPPHSKSTVHLSATRSQLEDSALARPAIRVAAVGADSKLRQAITSELAGDPRTWLVACAPTVACLRFPEFEKIDVLLVGQDIGKDRGLDLIASIREHNSKTRAIVISDKDDDEGALRAFDSGAAGWLALDNWTGGFMLAVLVVAQGGCALSASMARRLMRRSESVALSTDRTKRPPVTLTERERQVLEHVAAGLSTKEIARRMNICTDTVNFHVKSTYRKLHAHTRTHLVRLATEAGFLPN